MIDAGRAVDLPNFAASVLRSFLFLLSPGAADHLLRIASTGAPEAEHEYLSHLLALDASDLVSELGRSLDEEDEVAVLCTLLWRQRLGQAARCASCLVEFETMPYAWFPLRCLAISGYDEVVERPVEIGGQRIRLKDEAERMLRQANDSMSIEDEDRLFVLPDLLNVLLATSTDRELLRRARRYYEGMKRLALEEPLQARMNAWNFGLLAFDLRDRSVEAREALWNIEALDLNQGSWRNFPAWWAAGHLFGGMGLEPLGTWLGSDAVQLVQDVVVASPPFWNASAAGSELPSSS